MADMGSLQVMPTLKVSEGATEQALAYLDQHTAFTKGMNSTVQALREDMAQVRQAASDGAFHHMVDEWIDAYQGVATELEKLRDGLEAGRRELSRGAEEVAGGACAHDTVDDMRQASRRIDTRIAHLRKGLEPLARSFVGQAAEAWSQFQERIARLEDAMRTSLAEGSELLDGGPTAGRPRH